MTASELDKHVFETRLARAEMFELMPLTIDGFEQRRNSKMRLQALFSPVLSPFALALALSATWNSTT